MNFKTLILLSLILLGGICTGCDRFLDVQPKDQYTEKQLLATRGGYYTAMNSLYNNLTSNSLYGKNLSYELIDVISKRYAPLAKSTYLTSLNSWGYAEENVSKALESTWATAYTTILNCNVILENLATQQGILSPAETNLMKGELLALRAFLHFDMLRLFGPIYKEDPSAPSIPYNESVKIMNLPLLSADSIVHNKIMRDLDEAEKLLAKDPVIPEGPMASALEDENEVYLRYRQLRMNYYAVLALKARVYLYAGEKDKALQAAYKLLKDKTVSEWFPPVDPNKLLANNVDPDRVFSTEVLMGIYMKKRGDIYTYSFDAENAGNNFLQPRNSFVDGNLFAGETQDYRYQSQWAQATSIGVTGHIFTKYKAIQDGDAKLFYSSFMPLIRLSEMYYIAAECEPKVSDGNSWLNQIRTLRGLPEITITDENELMSKLRIEYLREFWGEGQIFFMYKRLFVNILNTENGHNTSTYGASAARYVPPHAGQRNRKPLKQHIMKTKKILYLFLLPLIFTACETKDIPVYTSDDAALYFQRTASYIWGSTTVTYSNSTEFTFAGAAAEKNSVTYSAEVRTMGNVTDYDRPFKVEIDKEMSTGIQGDSRGLLHVIDELRREDTPISRNIADHIDSFTDYDFAHLLFSDGTVENAISLDNQLNIIQVADLVLPDKDTTFEEYTTIELLSVSMLIVISTFALDFIHSDRSIFKIVDLDEAWAFLNVAQGETLSNKLVRAGRAMQAGVYFVTQSSGDVSKESLKNNIGLKFAFRSTDINEIKQTLEFFGIDKDDENNQKRLRDLENGQCLLQDLYGRVGVVQIHPVFEELLHAFDTRPPVQRNEVE